MNVLDLVLKLLGSGDPYAEVLIGEGVGFADTLTKTSNGFVLIEPLPPVMAEALAAHQPVAQALIDPDCGAGKHGSCVGAPCTCACHSEPGLKILDDDLPGLDLPPLPQRDRPVRTTVAALTITGADDQAWEPAPESPLARWAGTTPAPDANPPTDANEEVSP